MSEIAPESSPELPDIDDRLVVPESRLEVIDGRLSYVPPADPPHAVAHVGLARLVGGHVDGAFTVAADMLTRTSRIDDIAPDLSIFPAAPDPQSGRRQLEQLAFEIASTESLGHVAIKASKLAARGVRRVFALHLDRDRLLEWDRERGSWTLVDRTALLVDPVFSVPLPVAALLDTALLDDAIVAAYRQRRHPAFLAERAEGHADGYAKARAASIVDILERRGLRPSPVEVARILAERDLDRLERWASAVWTVEATADLLAAD